MGILGTVTLRTLASFCSSSLNAHQDPRGSFSWSAMWLRTTWRRSNGRKNSKSLARPSSSYEKKEVPIGDRFLQISDAVTHPRNHFACAQGESLTDPTLISFGSSHSHWHHCQQAIFEDNRQICT